MRRLLSLLVVLAVAGCSGAAGSAGADRPSGASAAPSTPAATASSGGAPSQSTAPTAAQASSGGGAVALPAECAKGLADYLVAIQPIVATFDPAKSTLNDLLALQEPVRAKGLELLKANNGRATYSCSDEGLEWASFTSTSPWDSVLAVATEKASGTVPYLTGLKARAALDATTLAQYNVAGCDAAVAAIKKAVKDQKQAGAADLSALAFPKAMDLAGLYRAYMRDVQNEVCPRDALGDDEFQFMRFAS